jgi:Fe-S cluster biogenesis protein NfuA
MEKKHAIDIWAEVTPNPHTLKFNVSKELLTSGSVNFPDKEKAKGHLLAEELFGIENVLGVMVGPSFITVTKAPAVDWSQLAEPVSKKIRELLESGKVLFSQEARSAHAETPEAGGNGDIERRVREILDTEIRPAVAMDGGDIIFHGYKDGVVTLHLQGACMSCPSSILTLKMGVENRLKSLIPEIKEVVQV